jgi:2-dehydro-3-deoxygluconokinase
VAAGGAMTNPDIIVIGEPMIEFSQLPVDRGGNRDGSLFLKGFGGDASNFAIAAARQGATVAFCTRLGDDAHGVEFRALYEREKVDISGVVTDPAAPTAVYFIQHGSAGHQFSYLRAGSAASRHAPADLPSELIASAKFLHTTGISLAISSKAADTCFAAMATAKQSGARISFDTNLRLQLWPLPRAKAVMLEAIRQSDILLPSLDDITSLSGETETDAILDWCLGLGPTLVVLKLGKDGAIVANPKKRVKIAPFPCKPLDATGAGDVFGGAFISRLAAGDKPDKAARYAAAAAALSTEGYGAVAPIPNAERVTAALGGWRATE